MRSDGGVKVDRGSCVQRETYGWSGGGLWLTERYICTEGNVRREEECRLTDVYFVVQCNHAEGGGYGQQRLILAYLLPYLLCIYSEIRPTHTLQKNVHRSNQFYRGRSTEGGG